jgi:hypothetical protein
MLDRIEKKILDIRNQPEPVRMRYLLMSLLVTMFFVVIIWIFSLKESVRDISNTNINVSLPALPLEKGQSLESLVEQNKALGGSPKGNTEQTNLFEDAAQ